MTAVASLSQHRSSTDNTRIHAALKRARSVLERSQAEDGSWRCTTDLGPVGMAMQLLTESLFDALPEGDHAGAVEYFRARQRSDGSFEAYPRADTGCLSTTSLCWAALKRLGPDGQNAAELARRYIEDQGGLKAVTRLFRTRGDTAGLFLLSHGHVGPEFLPRLLPGVALAPLGLLLDGRVHAGNIMFLLVLSALSEHHQPKRTGLLSRAKSALEKARIRSYLLDWQNVDGGWNGSPLQTCLMLVGLHALGETNGDPAIARALSWLDGMKRRGAELDVCAMENDVWSTALAMMALHSAGASRDSAHLVRAIEYLLSAQCRKPMRKENQRKPNAIMVGGWPFQMGNDSMPDTDDTGVVIATLAGVAGEVAPRALFGAIDDGVAWLRDMQNPDGGFPTFVWGLPSKAPGPMFLEEMPVELDDPKAMIAGLIKPQAEYGDPALAGVTGRVLWGLGKSGIGRNDPAVCQAIEFVRHQQCPSGAWWGRWKTCYLAETATVLVGLGAVGEDMDAEYVQRALRWILSCQNSDGGFGELPDAYRDPLRAGQGPSMVPVTAYVMLGCLAAGCVHSEAMDRSAEFLLERQQADGLWDNDGWLHTFIPPRLMYTYDMPAKTLPVVALAELARCQSK